ncbi:MAG TPA: DUF58 domain-containing protein, partial [Dehalococcoidia bacterium]|nr:DUF58 domain-containing protein [Dehalococcoidia bacterium]
IAFTDRVELYLRPRKGQHHVLRMARDLIYHRTRGTGTSIEAATDFLMRVAKRPGVAFIISDFHARGYAPSLRLAAQKHDVIAVSITDPREVELPPAGLVALRDPESGAETLIDTEDRRERERYAAMAAERLLARRRLLTGLGVDEVPLRTDRSYVEPLMQFFRARAGRRVARA